VPLLYGFSSPAPPLGQFQGVIADKQGIQELVTSINRKIDQPLEDHTLANVFKLLASS
jgi:hypothetical protein